MDDLFHYYFGDLMKRFAFSMASLAAFVGAGYSFYHFGVKPSYYEQVSMWLVVLPASVLLVIAFVLLWRAMSDNIHNIKSGSVINHSFTPAHMTQPTYVPGTPAMGNNPGTAAIYIPGYWVEDDWALQLEDATGRTGWIHFASNVFTHYPVGSRYQSSDE